MSIDKKFTPGQWHPIEYAGYWCVQTEPHYGGEDLFNQEKIEAAPYNVQLASCSPEMFEILESLLNSANFRDGFPGRTKHIQELLKKATTIEP